MSLGTLPFVQTICGSLSFPLLASSAQALAPNHSPCCQDRQAQHSCQQPRVSWFLGNNIIAVALFPKGSDVCHKHNPNQNLPGGEATAKIGGYEIRGLSSSTVCQPVGDLEELLRPPPRGPFHHEKPLHNPHSFLYVPRLWCFCLEQKPLPGQTVPVDTNIDRVAKAIQVGISPWESTEGKENDSDFKPSSFSKGLSRVLETLRTCLRHGLSICIVRGCV